MQSLSGTWKLALDPRNIGRQDRWFDAPQPGAKDAPVPGIVQQVFPNQFGVAWYWTTFAPLRQAGAGERCILEFEAVDYYAQVWLNGCEVGGHEGGETPFECDVTAAMRPGENLLAVRVVVPGSEPIEGMTMERVPHRCKKLECIPGRIQQYGGILGPVRLRVLPRVRIADLFVLPDPKTGKIRAQVTVRNSTAGPVKADLELQAGPDKGWDIQDSRLATIDAPPGDSTHVVELAIPQHRLWSLDDPFLYRVQAWLTEITEEPGRDAHAIYGRDARGTHGQDGHATSQAAVRSGFRELRVERGYFRLNGKRIILRSTHTGNHFPVTTAVPMDPDLVRRDFIMAKAAGYNTVRFICGLARPEQLDFADEIGLMVYEESAASWEPMEDTPELARRFALSVREMVLRDRNHACVTIWGLLNETPDGPVFRAALDSLPMLRELDPSRLVLLNSSRWDGRQEIGSICNPGSDKWEYQWGCESPAGKPVAQSERDANGVVMEQFGDIHIYPPVPLTDATRDRFSRLGQQGGPVFLSEYGAGSIINVIRAMRWYEQIGAKGDLSEVQLFGDQARRLEEDWKRWGFDGVYPFAEDLMRDSERLHTHQRRVGFDMVRANGRICGFNVTGMLDHGFCGEGVWTFWREWKPGTAETFCDGWAPLRWCLFVNPLHAYAGESFTLRAVLANENVLPPGEYPVHLRVSGAQGTVWEKRLTLRLPAPPPGEDAPLAVEAFCRKVRLDVPPGEYTFAANMERGGAPFGGRLNFRVAAPVGRAVRSAAVRRSLEELLTGSLQTRLWGVSREVGSWLEAAGVQCMQFDGRRSRRPGAILVGNAPGREHWRALAEEIARGSCVVFLSLDGLGGRESESGAWMECLGKPTTTLVRDFAVPNASSAEQKLYSSEFFGPLHFRACGLPRGKCRVEIGMCEGFCTGPGKRVYDVKINGKTVISDMDLFTAAGGAQRALLRTFEVAPSGGAIDIDTVPRVNSPSMSFVRIRDAAGSLLLQYDVASHNADTLGRMPLARKGRIHRTADWLYHKECVSKPHPIFDGLHGKGIMDGDFYGQVISQRVLEDMPDTDEVIAAAFQTGPYSSGIMMAAFPFGAGRFVVSAFDILEHIGRNVAADRLLLNMVRYAQERSRSKVAPLPRHFPRMLKGIGY